MSSNYDIDFTQIVPRGGSKHDAFEELCCQLARKTDPENYTFVRLHGAGGDGGVECFLDLSDGSRVGWQAKYVFDVKKLLTQATGSLTTALKIHPTLSRFIVCFPFDLTGPTGRASLSGQEKFDNWKKSQEEKAQEEGRDLRIEAWPAFRIRELLFDLDASGGVREFFFNQQILTTEWFSKHLESARVTAGPRYVPELNVKTDLWKYFSAFGRTPAWSDAFVSKIRACRKANNNIVSALNKTDSDSMSPAWPEESRVETQSLQNDVAELLEECDRLVTIADPDLYSRCIERLGNLLDSFKVIESQLVTDLEQKHGKGKADSPGFRQFMAEYMVSFPAANLDHTRETIAALADLQEWLRSPACSLAYETVFVLSGIAGSGKTHGVCDIADQRYKDDRLTCVLFGHEFRGEPDPWTRLTETLGLPHALGMDAVLDALNAAAEASGSILFLCIDAINETRPLRYWRERLPSFLQAIQRRSYLRLCVTCRTSFLPYCLPDHPDIPIIEHIGFAGVERDACQIFFRHYGLEAPIDPVLQPELSNPLYLRLVCETLKARGLHRLPMGWYGIAPAIKAFLEEKNQQFAREHEGSLRYNTVTKALLAIVRAMVDEQESTLPWSEAQRVVAANIPQADNIPILDWLVREDLLIEDVHEGDALFDAESVIRPAFERLGDFLIATELLERCKHTGLKVACQQGGVLHFLWKDPEILKQNSGILAALSILIPEHHPGIELPHIVEEESTYDSLVQIAVRSFPSRSHDTFTEASQSLINEALRMQDFSAVAMDSLLTVSRHPSIIDAFWLDQLLRQNPLAHRDAFWCGYLHDRFESAGIVYQLIDSAFELPLEQLELETAERWTIVLLWFTAAADRRVKDRATRAVTFIMTAQPAIVFNVVQRLLDCDDDEVKERALLSGYAALLMSRDIGVLKNVTTMLHDKFQDAPSAFDNAIIRDLIRCICELAQELNVLPEGVDPEFTMEAIDSEWPLNLPTEEQVKDWGEILHFRPDEFFSDFFKYSMGCLRPWQDNFPKKVMGEWIIQRAIRDFGYKGSGCEKYDNYMLGQHGGGRSKPKWAERIGKKYQWIGMYQLASRLHDHVERKRDDWEPKLLRNPLILLEERKLDPTIPANIIAEKQQNPAWWISESVDLDSAGMLSDEEWVNQQEGIPPFEKLLASIEHGCQTWRLLVSYPSWGSRDEDADWNDPYRHSWMHIQSYLVRKQDFKIAYNTLHRRNLFGGWMPECANWLYGFAGEYPWATPFNTEPESWHGRGSRGEEGLPVDFHPSWNQLAVEWEYDATLKENIYMNVPARLFFSEKDLWWNRIDGFCTQDGRTIFRDPSVTETGPASLLVNEYDLLERLNKLGLRLIWMLLGEKWILGGSYDKQTPRRTFSQIAYLGEDGSLHVGERVFFDDYDEDAGPNPIEK